MYSLSCLRKITDCPPLKQILFYPKITQFKCISAQYPPIGATPALKRYCVHIFKE